MLKVDCCSLTVSAQREVIGAKMHAITARYDHIKQDEMKMVSNRASPRDGMNAS